MPVRVARYAGFCMGVRRAVDGALRAAHSGEEIVSYGEVAHNPEVIRSLEEQGIHVIHSPEEAVGKTVLIRSHGVAPSVLHQLGLTAKRVEDLTCPFVARLHRVVSEYSRSGLPVILVGQADHPEVIGTIGYAAGSVYTIESLEEAARLPSIPRALIVSQTTLPQDRWEAILPIVQERVEKLTVENTICTATAQRQSEASRLAAECDAVIVIGGRSSANTRKLYETCRGICARTILVERASEIPAGFANIHSDSIGITAGASTPDWSLKEVVTTMTDKEQINQQEDFMSQMEATLVKIRPGQTVKGTVLTMNDEFVGVNIGYKSDGLMKREDLITEDVKPGDEIEVEVVKVNDGEGNVLLSQRNIQNRKAIAELVEKKESGEYVEGVGKEAVKGGLICIVNGIRAFVPASQLSNRFVTKIEDYVGQPMKLKILEVDEAKRRIVASRRAVVAEELAAKKAETWAKLVEGEIVHGIVRRLTKFGAFVDLGGVDGLIRITDLCWHHVKDISEVVSENQEVDVKVLSVDAENGKVGLGLKQLQPKPWDVAPEKYPVGSIVTGIVVRTPEFGAFVELEPGLDGLIHISQCADHRIEKVTDAVNVGDEVTVKVLGVDPEKKRISLSIRALLVPEVAPVEEAPVEEAPVEEAVPVDVENV